jgi:hypothetical protein
MRVASVGLGYDTVRMLGSGCRELGERGGYVPDYVVVEGARDCFPG